MNVKNVIKLVVIILIVVFLGAVMFNGLPLSKVVGYYDILPVTDSISYGLDFTGGVYVVLEAAETGDAEADADNITRAIATIRERIDSLGVKEPTIAKQGTNKIRVSIPDITDQQEALELIGKTALLEFHSPDGEVILTGEDVKNAAAVYQTSSLGTSTPVVSLEFTENGTELFAAATETYYGQTIEIVLDGEVISSPTVNAVITDGKAIIEGMADFTEATNLATLIKAGALPVELTVVEVKTIGATLGQNALETSLRAAVVGILLVFVFMIAMYRVPGFISCVALSVYIIIYLFIMSWMKVTLTLSGVAGIVLSIGMAVDANVIIFERIREELMLGKTLLPSINTGFSRAFASIIDSNVTTIIAAVVLFLMGTGTVRGFALTLMIGILVSMFTSLTITKKLLKIMQGTNILNSKKCYGVREVAQ